MSDTKKGAKPPIKKYLLGISTSLVLCMILVSNLPQAFAHELQSCIVSNAKNPVGIMKKGNDMWVAFSGTGELLKYDHQNCLTINTYALNAPFNPDMLADAGTNRIFVTDKINGKVMVFNTSTNSEISRKNLSIKPYDIATDPANTSISWFTSQNSNNIAKYNADTNSVSTSSFPGTGVGLARGITIDDGTDLFFSDIGADKIWKRPKTSSTYTSKVVAEGNVYSMVADTTNNQIWFPATDANKLLGLPMNFTSTTGSFTKIRAQLASEATDGVAPTHMFRIASEMSGSDVIVIYDAHVAAIHVPPQQIGWHNADALTGIPMDVASDTTVQVDAPGEHVTVEDIGSLPSKIVLLKHFPA